jgi:hypothetical protein
MRGPRRVFGPERFGHDLGSELREGERFEAAHLDADLPWS